MLPEWFLPFTGIMLGVVGSVWSLAWWLSKQFGVMRSLVYDKIEALQKAILDKLEYHERHDDQRFTDIRKDIFTIQLRNASIDGARGQTGAQQEETIKSFIGRTVSP